MTTKLKGWSILAFDVAGPATAYYAARAAGAGERSALLLAVAVAAIRVLWDIVHTKAITRIAALMLVSYGLSLVLTYVTGDERFMLLKESFTTGAIAVVALATCAGGRPLTLTIAQSLHPADAEAIAHRFNTDPAERRFYRRGTLGWGLGLLTEAAVRMPLVYALPVDVMPAVSQLLMLCTVAGLFSWTHMRRRRRAQRQPVTDRGAAR